MRAAIQTAHRASASTFKAQAPQGWTRAFWGAHLMITQSRGSKRSCKLGQTCKLQFPTGMLGLVHRVSRVSGAVASRLRLAGFIGAVDRQHMWGSRQAHARFSSHHGTGAASAHPPKSTVQPPGPDQPPSSSGEPNAFVRSTNATIKEFPFETAFGFAAMVREGLAWVGASFLLLSLCCRVNSLTLTLILHSACRTSSVCLRCMDS